MEHLKILYEDNHIIAVYKPAGILSQSDMSGDVSILDEVKTNIKKKYQKPGNVFLGLVHRLDRPVSGIIVFAKTSKGASRLSEQFRNGTVEKKYSAIVTGQCQPRKGTLVNFLGKDEKLHKGKEYTNGERAVLHYQVLRSNGQYSLLGITIEGGKFHQIRTQLSLAGFPILGDVKYKGEKWQYENAIALCATEISFKKATEEEQVHLKVEPPTEWNSYV
jgi:23S rRNA pseudouridine1911/1915/1917 synthase